MLQLILHFWGDYIFQNSWMANKKTNNTVEGVSACLIHCMLYTTLFKLFLSPSFVALSVIFITHFFIDKYRLAKYIPMITNWRFDNNNGFHERTPPYLSFWLIIIIDNGIHLTINFLALKYL